MVVAVVEYMLILCVLWVAEINIICMYVVVVGTN